MRPPSPVEARLLLVSHFVDAGLPLADARDMTAVIEVTAVCSPPGRAGRLPAFSVERSGDRILLHVHRDEQSPPARTIQVASPVQVEEELSAYLASTT